MTWRYGTLEDSFNIGLRGRMLCVIHSYLGGRTFRVKLGATLSKKISQENGVPQGGVLSVTLFSVKIKSTSRIIPPFVQYLFHVDDVQILVSSYNPSICERLLQLAINN